MVAALCVRVLVLSLFVLWPDVNGLGGEKPSAVRRHHELGQASPRARAAFSVYRGEDVSASDPSQAWPVEGYSRLSSVFSAAPRSHQQEEIYGDVPEGPAVLQSKEGMWDFPDSAVETPKPWQQVPKKLMPLPKTDDWWTGFGPHQQPPTHQVTKPQLPPWLKLPGQKPTYPGQKPVQHPYPHTYPVDKKLPPWSIHPGQKPTYPEQKPVQHQSPPTYPVDKDLPPWLKFPGDKQPLPPTYPARKPVQHPSPPIYPVDEELPPWPMLPGQKPTYLGQKLVQHPSYPTYPVDKELPSWLNLPGEKLPQKQFQPTYPAQEPHPYPPTYPVDNLPPWPMLPGQKPTYPGQKLVQHTSHPTYPVDKELPPWLKLPGEKLPQKPFLPYPGQNLVPQVSQPTYPVDKKYLPQVYPLPTLPDLQQPSYPTYPVDAEPHSWLKLSGENQEPSLPTYPVNQQAKQQQPWLTYSGYRPSTVPQSKDDTWQFDFNMKAGPRTSSVQVFRMTPRRVPGQSQQRPNMESTSSNAEHVPRSGPASKVYGAAPGSYVWRQPDRGAQRLHGSSSKQR